MTTETGKQTLGFQAEVKQLLQLMIHSLYSNKEIFLRELISNASDAADRLRFEALSDASLFENDPDLRIRIDYDGEAGTVTVSDNGIGMSREEVVEQLGTIAKSGTADFLNSLTGDQQRDSLLIGQFGVGFYSSFVVSERVEVLTRRAGLEAETGVRWASTGEGEFSVESIDKADRGTTVVVHLREGEGEFADGFRLRNLVRKYSDHISFPVIMKKEAMPGEKDEDTASEDETVNTAKALWTRPRAEVEDEEYCEFYKHVSHDFEDPLLWSHNKVEGKRDYTSLLYIPARASFDLWNRESPRGLKLYVRRVFILDRAEEFLPLYLRFVRGVVDSDDLPLNVSRELLQRDPNVEAMRSALTKRVLDMLARIAKETPDKYATFWKEFGTVLKEGPIEDHANRDKIAGLLRFATTHTAGDEHQESLQDYVGRMQTGQEKIYYIFADNHATASNSPHLEVFRHKGIEVLLLTDRIDDWLVSQLGEFDGRAFSDVMRGELDLGELSSKDEKQAQQSLAKEHSALMNRVATALGERVDKVRATTRLTRSPACLVVGEHEMGGQMRRLLEAAGQKVPESKPILEINPHHPLVERLAGEEDNERFSGLASIIFDQASLAEGGQLVDPADYVMRMNELLLELAGEAPAGPGPAEDKG